MPRLTTAISCRVVRPLATGHLEFAEHGVDTFAIRERLLDEEVLDALVLAAAEQHDVRVLDAAARAPDLLVVGHDRAWGLVMHDEGQVGLVVAHPQRAGRHHRFDFVAQQTFLGRDPVVRFLFARVGERGDAVGVEELGHLLGVAFGQRVDDPRARQPRDVLDEPGQPLGRLR